MKKPTNAIYWLIIMNVLLWCGFVVIQKWCLLFQSDVNGERLIRFPRLEVQKHHRDLNYSFSITFRPSDSLWTTSGALFQACRIFHLWWRHKPALKVTSSAYGIFVPSVGERCHDKQIILYWLSLFLISSRKYSQKIKKNPTFHRFRGCHGNDVWRSSALNSDLNTEMKKCA